MDAPQLVSSPEALAALAGRLQGVSTLAVDTEAASFHRHAKRIYLIQVSSREETALVDPLGVPDLGPLGGFLQDPGVEVVFHDADYDLRLLDHQYGVRVRGLFDTRIAAELLNEPGLSLAALLEAHFGVRLNKRFQRADWSARPLSEEMLEYAATDTRHLVALRDLLADRLREVGRLAWAEEEFRALEQVRWEPDPDREPGWLRLKGAKGLKPRELAILREVYDWRRGLAERLDRAEFRIMGNEALFAIAREAPDTPEALETIRGVGRETLKRRGRSILAAVRRGLRVPERALPRIPRPPRREREPEVEARVARLKGARGRISERLGLAPGVVCPNHLLEAIARAEPADREALGQVPGVRTWQAETFGDELLAALRTP